MLKASASIIIIISIINFSVMAKLSSLEKDAKIDVAITFKIKATINLMFEFLIKPLMS